MNIFYTFESSVDFEKALILSPTRSAVSAIEKWLLREREAADGIWITTPLELTNTLFELYLAKTGLKNACSAFEYLEILLETLGKRNNINPYSTWAQKTGFRSSLISFFSDMDKSLLPVNLLKEILSKCKNKYIMDAFALYRDFDEVRNKRGISREVDALSEIISAVPDLINSKGLEGGIFLIVPAYDWSALQVRIIRAVENIMGHFKQLNYMMPCNNLTTSFRGIFKKEEFNDLSPSENDKVIENKVIRKSIYLFSTPPNERTVEAGIDLQVKPPLKIIAAENPLNEVRETVEAILNWLDEGVDPEDIAIISRKADPYGFLFYHYGKVNNTHLVGGRLLPDIQYLSTGSHQIIPLLELAVHDGITLKSIKNLFLHPSLKHEKRKDIIDVINALIRNPFFSGTIKDWLPCIEDASAKNIFTESRKYYYFPQNSFRDLDSLIPSIITLAKKIKELADADSFAAFVSILKEIFEKYADNEPMFSYLVNHADFRFLHSMDGFALLRAMAEDLSTKHERIHGIIPFYEAMEGRGLAARKVVILGFNEGLWNTNLTGEYFLSEKDRIAIEKETENMKLADFCSSILPKRPEIEERLILESILANVSEEMLITYSRQDMAGKSLVPSQFLKDICSCFIRSIMGDLKSQEIIERLYKIPDESISSLWIDKDDLLNNMIDFKISEGINKSLITSAINNISILSYYEGTGNCHLESYRDTPINIFEITWSPTIIKKIITCPYRYLLENVHKLRGEEEDDIENLMRGSILHRFYNYLLTDFKGKVISVISKDDWDRNTENKLRVFIKQEIDNAGNLSRNLQWKIFFNNIIEECKYFSDIEFERINNNRISLLDMEYQFGFNESAAVNLGGLDKPLLFKGIVDRIEEENGSTNIIDYKTGKHHSGLELKKGLEFQGLLYPLALNQTCKAQNSRGFYYYCTSESENKKNKIIENIINEYELADIMISLNDITRNGLFPPLPKIASDKDGGTCTTCSVRSICQAPYRKESIESLKRSPLFSEFLKTRGKLTGETDE